jgi:hypothetical protein
MRMPFGKYAGQELEGLPTSYLLWVFRTRRTLPPGVRQAVWRILDGRGFAGPALADPPPGPFPDWSALIRQWYRGLVLDYHPDRGGPHEAMQIINEAHERLRKLAGL